MSAPSDNLAVRPATEADLPALLVLLEQLTEATEAPTVDGPERTVAGLRHFLGLPGTVLLLADRNREVVGAATLNIRRTLLHPAPVALIDELVVAGSARGQGVGKRLIAELINYARGRGCCELEVGTEASNTSALKFYRGCGFDTEHVLLEMDLKD